MLTQDGVMVHAHSQRLLHVVVCLMNDPFHLVHPLLQVAIVIRSPWQWETQLQGE